MFRGSNIWKRLCNFPFSHLSEDPCLSMARCSLLRKKERTHKNMQTSNIFHIVFYLLLLEPLSDCFSVEKVELYYASNLILI